MRLITKVLGGEKFGKFTVLESTVGKTVKCLCECGLVKSVNKYNLTHGKSKSCGKGKCQSTFNDLSGMRFGNLFVHKYYGSDRHDHGALWECECDCGKITITRGQSLRSQKTTSCGCKRIEKLSKALSKKPLESNYNQLYATYKNMAKIRGYSFNISNKYFRKIIGENCQYCGSKPSQKQLVKNALEERVLLYNGIDRVDNSIGYEETNVVTCCGICNIAKKAMSVDNFLGWVKKVYNYSSERGLIK